MASQVSICNLALSNLAKDNINTLTEATAEARACNQFYSHTLDLLLQSYPWRFAGKTSSLAQIDNDKPGAWRYAYQRPTDCLKVRSVRPQYSDIDATIPRYAPRPEGFSYDLEGQSVYCNLSPAFLRYTQRLVDPTKFSPMFIDALAWHLAVRLAMPLTRDPKIRADALSVANSMQTAAEVADANEVRETSDIETEFVTARDDIGHGGYRTGM